MYLRKFPRTSIKLINSFNILPVANFSDGGEVQKYKQPSDSMNEYAEKVKLYRKNIFEILATKRNTFMEWHKYSPMNVSVEGYRAWKAKMSLEREIFDQRFIKERHDILGDDIAAAHFIVYRNGRVRFKDNEKWIEKPPDEEDCFELPNKFVRNMYLEAIDASNTRIRHEGLVNLRNLKQLKWLSFMNCETADDWFVDRLSGEVQDTLEHLNLSNCTNLTKNSLSCFYRFKNLKRVLLHNVVKNKEFEFSCMLLEDAIPGLIIIY
ncbi:hypothetical protein O3M35_000119 [Rhynocoris fuscipes]|uniref:Mitochondrial ATP synthase regulatory component factor B n=1 Tax=Rhynocoris fuscipes TaxID=488301 RepID=A0AAW1DL07_9HEMI